MDALLQYGFPLSLALYATGAVSSLALGARPADRMASAVSHAIAALAALAGLGTGLAVIASGTIVVFHGGGIGLMPDMLALRLDALAGFFLAMISIVAFAASVYGIAYQRQFFGEYRLAGFGLFYNLFLAGMSLVVAADNAVLFLFAWELMAITSYFLVVFERRDARNITAGGLYILISQLGAAFLFAAFVILYGAFGSWDFETLRAHAAGLPALLQNIVLLLALVGFASKAGVIPLHIWLPEAHPAAPSHDSAIMSGVMIKTAIFMIIRFFVEFFAVDYRWGLLIIVLGAVSSLMGILYALSERDIKRLLAFSSVENIGIILLGLGGAIVFFSYDMPLPGIFSLSAALYHAVNHALFKSLLFLSAGSVVHAVGTRNMEGYGGLIKLMPYTAFFFLIGAVAISGLPPFNGFVSEWLTLQSLFLGIAQLPLWPKAIFIAGASSLTFTGGLAAACFVKAFGTTFLARGRGQIATRVHEASLLMKAPMALLAFLTLMFGVGASTFAPILSNIALSLHGASGPLALASPFSSIALPPFASLSMTAVAAVLIAGVAAIYLYAHFMARGTKRIVSRTWDCGYPLSPRMEITATGFSRSIIVIFRGLLRPSIQKSAEYHDAATRYFAKSRTVHLYMPNLYRTYLYAPAALFVERSAQRARRIQTGNLNVYLLYMLLTVAGLLLWTLH